MLDRITVAAPCSADWESMPGSDRVRHCALCDKNVYNLSAMTRREAEELIRDVEGRLCARFYRRADGTILTENCPVALRSLGRSVSRWAGAAISAMMAFSATSIAQFPLIQIASAQEQDTAHAILGVVQDPTGAVIPRAEVSLWKENSDKMYKTESDYQGRFRVESLPGGSYRLRVQVSGFSTFEKFILVGPGPEMRVTATMTLSVMGEVVEVKPNKRRR